jgi:hypothetical protein
MVLLWEMTEIPRYFSVRWMSPAEIQLPGRVPTRAPPRWADGTGDRRPGGSGQVTTSTRTNRIRGPGSTGASETRNGKLAPLRSRDSAGVTPNRRPRSACSAYYIGVICGDRLSA